jgi:hypothetical protein
MYGHPSASQIDDKEGPPLPPTYTLAGQPTGLGGIVDMHSTESVDAAR